MRSHHRYLPRYHWYLLLPLIDQVSPICIYTKGDVTSNRGVLVGDWLSDGVVFRVDFEVIEPNIVVGSYNSVLLRGSRQ